MLLGSTMLVSPMGCTSKKDRTNPRPLLQSTSPKATPTPPFNGPAPSGALKVSDIEIGRYGGTMVLAMAGDPKSFNPLTANEASSNLILRLMFAYCWSYHNGRQEAEPGLCESYERSQDGLTYTFTIREGLKWSDGHPLTADDFEFSYRVMMDPKIPNSDKDLFSQGHDESGQPRYPKFKRLGDRKFQFMLHRPDVLFHFAAGSYAVMPKHRWQAAYKAGRFRGAMSVNMALENMVGSGPFIVSTYQSGRRVSLVRNPNYWKVDPRGNRLPYLDAVDFMILPDEQAMLRLFEAGGSHLHDVLPSEYDRLKRRQSQGDYRVVELGPSFNTNYLMFNLDPRLDAQGRPQVDPVRLNWFSKKGFRAAVSHAIDRDTIVRNVLQGRGQPLWSYVSPANRQWHPKSVVKYPFDLNQSAQQLLKEGFVKRDGALYDSNGNPVKFTIMTNAENGTRIAMLKYIKEDLSRLGMDVTIEPRTFNDIVTALRDTRRFDAVLLGWGVSVPPDPAFSKNVLMSTGRSHNWYPEQPKPATPWEAEIDALLVKNTSTTDPKERKVYSDKLFRVFSEYQPQIQLVVIHDAAVARNSVGNFKPSALRPRTHWNIDTLFFKE